jgi:hypothetical protein
MSYGPLEFLESIIDALNINPPGTGEYDPSECADLALAEITRLQRRDEQLKAHEKEPVTRQERIKLAAELVKMARNHLRAAGAHNAADYVARALKSVEGAQRHARGLETREDY